MSRASESYTMYLLLLGPLIAVCIWIAHAYGAAHEIIYGPWLKFSDITLAIGIVLACAISAAIWRIPPASRCAALMWVGFFTYALMGIWLGNTCMEVFDVPRTSKGGLDSLGFVVGGWIGTAIGRAASSQISKSE
jgi:hypothetical protein